MPLVNKTFDQLLDFTRTTSGTFVGSDGLIQTTPASANLLTWTQQFDNAAWIKSLVTVSANIAVAPDGTSTADNMIEDTTNNVHRVRQSCTAALGVAHTVTIYAKPVGSRRLYLNCGGLMGAGALFDFSGSGSVVATSGAAVNLAASIATVGNGWFRCTLIGTGTGSAENVLPQINRITSTTATDDIYLGDGTSGLTLWGAQVEVGSTATTYTRNNGGVFPPRFDYDPVTLAAKGLLVEEQRVNVLTYSEQFDNAAWVKSGLNTTGTPAYINVAVSPDGTQNADFMIEDTANSQHTTRVSANMAATTTHTYSFFVKAAGRTSIDVNRFNSAVVPSFSHTFTLSGSGSSSGGTVTALSNGWYRCSGSFTTTGAGVGGVIILLSDGTTTTYTGDGTSGIYIYGAQLEAGVFATSYIPTVASQVTRTADICTIVAPNFAPWYNQSEGTIVVEADTAKPTTLGLTAIPATISAGSTSNLHQVRFVSNTVDAICTTGGSTDFDAAGVAYTVGVPLKAAYAYKINDFAFVVNGGAPQTDAAGLIPVVDRLNIGTGPTNANNLNGHIRSIRYYPVRLSNAQIQALTA